MASPGKIAPPHCQIRSCINDILSFQKKNELQFAALSTFSQEPNGPASVVRVCREIREQANFDLKKVVSVLEGTVRQVKDVVAKNNALLSKVALLESQKRNLQLKLESEAKDKAYAQQCLNRLTEDIDFGEPSVEEKVEQMDQ